MKTKTSILAATKAFFILLIVCFFSSCNTAPRKKPYVIIDKESTSWTWEEIYTYQDANGNTYSFDDDWDKYSIGDTIK